MLTRREPLIDNLNVFGMILVLLLVWNYWLPTYLYSTVLSIGPTDWGVFYLAGKLWLQHQNPYLANIEPAGFVYPPVAIPLFGVYAMFDIDFAGELWMITYVILFVLTIIVLALTLKSERRWLYSWAAVILSLTSYPLMVMMKLGQFDMFLSSICILSLAILRLRHPTCSACLLALGTLLQGPPIFLLIFFVVFRKDLRYLAHFIVASMIIVAASLTIIPTSFYWTYLTKIIPTLTTAASESSAQSLVSLVSILGMAAFTPVLSILGFLLFAIFCFWIGQRIRSKNPACADAVFLMNVLLILALGPRSWDHTYVWVILPLALFLSAVFTQKTSIAYLILVGFATFLLNATVIQLFLPYPLTGAELSLLIIGNMTLIGLLAAICVWPQVIIHSVKEPIPGDPCPG